MKQLSLAVTVVVVLVSTFLCYRIISNSFSNQKYNNDYAEISNIKYGLLSVDEWKRQIKAILSNEIERLGLARPDASALRKNIEEQLNNLIDSVYKQVREENSRSPVGWVKQSFINIFVNPGEIKKGIPGYADTILREITNSRTKSQVKAILNKQLDRYSKRTFSAQDTTHISRILSATGARDVAGAREKLKAMIFAGRASILSDARVWIILSVLLFALAGFNRPLSKPMYSALVLSLLLLLAAGVTTPMINMEAKITELRFVLMGHVIRFDDQVLYFQSKSVLDVFWLLINYKNAQMKFVGFLVVAFSVIFPVLKIFSSMAYYYGFSGSRKNPLIRFFVFKSGKWSMADVMVVAIFMAYIGASGIISDQLGTINRSSPDLAILTMNGTSLQPGYYLFVTYTLLAMVLSEYLASNTSRC